MPSLATDLQGNSLEVPRETVSSFPLQPPAYILIPRSVPNSALYVSHLKHTLQPLNEILEHLSHHARLDLGVTLIEASRFPNLAWKELAIQSAQIATQDYGDLYVQSRLAQARCLLSRISRPTGQAVQNPNDLSDVNLARDGNILMHSANGHGAIQHALNCIQQENITGAEKSLHAWRPMGQPTPAEQVVVFRKDMILGRAMRFRGQFTESLAHLDSALKTAEADESIIFSEDRRDLVCDLADTMRELADFTSADHLLRAQIARRDSDSSSPLGQSLLELSLAEILFAQERLEEADAICLEVQARPSLLKFEKLRLFTIMAKIRHVKFDNAGAMLYWTRALAAIGEFHLTNGRTTRTILLSICGIFGRQGEDWLVPATMAQVKSLDQMERPGSIQHWIAGTHGWLKYLQALPPRGRL